MEMILILLAIVVAAAVGFFLLHKGDDGYSNAHIFMCIFGSVFLIASGVSSIVYIIAGFEWFASGHKAEIINREYGTAYTQKEVFFASDVIDTVREIDRRRIELKGDLLRGEGDE